MLDPQKTLHTSPYRASYGVYFVDTFEKIDRLITAPHCTKLQATSTLYIIDYLNFKGVVFCFQAIRGLVSIEYKL